MSIVHTRYCESCGKQKEPIWQCQCTGTFTLSHNTEPIKTRTNPMDDFSISSMWEKTKDEDWMRFMYFNIKNNRDTCKELGKTNLEYFWSGNLSAFHSICDVLKLKYDWMNSRIDDFNNYKYSDQE